jgi:hypothetical protein
MEVFPSEQNQGAEDGVVFRCLHESVARPSVLSVWENVGSALIRAGIPNQLLYSSESSVDLGFRLSQIRWPLCVFLTQSSVFPNF